MIRFVTEAPVRGLGQTLLQYLYRYSLVLQTS